MKFFLEAFYKSISSPQWIADARHTGTKAWAYFFMFVFLVSLGLSVPVARQLPGMAAQVLGTIETNVPEFTATVKNGEIAVTGLEQPFERTFGDDANVRVVVNTASTSTLEDGAATYNTPGDETIFYLGRTGLATIDQSKHKMSVQKIAVDPSNKEEVSVTRTQILEKLKTLRSAAMYPVVALIMVSVFGVMAIGKLLYLLFVALIVKVIALVMKKTVTYVEILTMGLFAVTAPTLVNALIMLSGNSISFVYTLLLIGILMASIQKIGTVQAPPAVEDKKV